MAGAFPKRRSAAGFNPVRPVPGPGRSRSVHILSQFSQSVDPPRPAPPPAPPPSSPSSRSLLRHGAVGGRVGGRRRQRHWHGGGRRRVAHAWPAVPVWATQVAWRWLRQRPWRQPQGRPARGSRRVAGQRSGDDRAAVFRRSNVNGRPAGRCARQGVCTAAVAVAVCGVVREQAVACRRRAGCPVARAHAARVGSAGAATATAWSSRRQECARPRAGVGRVAAPAVDPHAPGARPARQLGPAPHQPAGPVWRPRRRQWRQRRRLGAAAVVIVVDVVAQLGQPVHQRRPRARRDAARRHRPRRAVLVAGVERRAMVGRRCGCPGACRRRCRRHRGERGATSARRVAVQPAGDWPGNAHNDRSCERENLGRPATGQCEHGPGHRGARGRRGRLG